MAQGSVHTSNAVEVDGIILGIEQRPARGVMVLASVLFVLAEVGRM